MHINVHRLTSLQAPNAHNPKFGYVLSKSAFGKQLHSKRGEFRVLCSALVVSPSREFKISHFFLNSTARVQSLPPLTASRLRAPWQSSRVALQSECVLLQVETQLISAHFQMKLFCILVKKKPTTAQGAAVHRQKLLRRDARNLQPKCAMAAAMDLEC